MEILIDPALEREAISLAHALGLQLQQRGAMVATAESCTGGAIARALTEIGGSSAWFDRAFVTYTNEAKQEMLGVSAATLQRFGAVSEETAREMAAGALARSHAKLAIAVTGIAGPGGAVPGKPVGTVCFGWALAGQAPQTQTMHFEGDRVHVRMLTVAHGVREAQILLSLHGPRSK